MQLSTTEILIIAALILAVFIGPRLLGELGKGIGSFRSVLKAREPEPEPATDPAPELLPAPELAGELAVEHPEQEPEPVQVGRDMNTAQTGAISNSVVTVGSNNQVTVINYPDYVAKLVDAPLKIFVSSAEGQEAERKAVLEAVRRLGLSRERLVDLVPSPLRSPEHVQASLAASDWFLLFAGTEVAEAQIRENEQAREKIGNRAYFSPLGAVTAASEALDEPPEGVTPYPSIEVLPDCINSWLVARLLFSFRAQNNPYKLTRAEMSLLFGLAEVLNLEVEGLPELRAWLAEPEPAAPVETAGPVPESLPQQPPETKPQPSEPHPDQGRPKPKDPAEPRKAGELRLSFRHVEAGEFWMGSDDADAWDREKPVHKVYLDEYWMARCPVTVADFKLFVAETGYPTAAEQKNDDYTWRTPRGKDSSTIGKEDHPVVQVTWHDAVAYCEWLGGRLRAESRRRITVVGLGEEARFWQGLADGTLKIGLPTEAQWEKAARGPAGNKYAWGDAAPSRDLCNINNWYEGTTPVGRFSPQGDSPYGCADMTGNVWEWCVDWYADNYYRESPSRNPSGPLTGTPRVLRGGSWYDNDGDARCSSRSWDLPGPRSGNRGFRVVVLPSSSL